MILQKTFPPVRKLKQKYYSDHPVNLPMLSTYLNILYKYIFVSINIKYIVFLYSFSFTIIILYPVCYRNSNSVQIELLNFKTYSQIWFWMVHNPGMNCILMNIFNNICKVRLQQFHWEVTGNPIMDALMHTQILHQTHTHTHAHTHTVTLKECWVEVSNFRSRRESISIVWTESVLVSGHRYPEGITTDHANVYMNKENNRTLLLLQWRLRHRIVFRQEEWKEESRSFCTGLRCRWFNLLGAKRNIGSACRSCYGKHW